MAEQSVYVCLHDTDQRRVADALPAGLNLEAGSSARLLEVLERAGATAAIADERLCMNPVSTRFLDLACVGVPWPAIQILREREPRWACVVPWAAAALHVNECRAKLWYVLRARVIAWRLAATAVDVRSRCRDADELGNALYVALLTDRPFATLTDLARASAVSRAKLYDLWSTVFNENDDLTPHRFLQWVLLLRGLAASDARGVGDRTVALRLRVPRSTLTHATRDLLGTTFSDVEEGFWLKPVIEFEGLLTKLGVVADRRIA